MSISAHAERARIWPYSGNRGAPGGGWKRPGIHTPIRWLKHAAAKRVAEEFRGEDARAERERRARLQAQIGRAHLLINEQVVSRAAEDYRAIFNDESGVGDAQAIHHVLFHDQDG